MKTLLSLAALLHASGLAAAVSSQTAIKCVGKTTTLPANASVPATRTYIIDDRSQTVAEWDAKAQAKIEVCLVGQCPKKFGANQIRVVQEDDGGSMMLDIERDAGAITHFVRSRSPASMTTFEGTCSKTVLPRSTVVRKF